MTSIRGSKRRVGNGGKGTNEGIKRGDPPTEGLDLVTGQTGVGTHRVVVKCGSHRSTSRIVNIVVTSYPERH